MSYCAVHQHYKWCEHNGGVPGPTGFEPPPQGLEVWLIGPESNIYHTDEECPVLRRTYWPVRHGELQADGSIIAQAWGEHTFRDRKLCKRCARWMEKKQEAA